MSDVIDVQNALVGVIAAAVYPNGTGAASVSGGPVIVYAGWPTSSRLDADLAGDKAHITVYPTQVETNKTRYSKDWEDASINTAGLAVAISGQKITVSGAVPVPYQQNNVSITVSGKPYVVAAVQADTPTTVAAALVALILVDWPGTTAAAGVITLPGIAVLESAIVGVTGTSRRELRRQQRIFQVTVWANTPDQRDALGAALDIALADISFLAMPDGVGARVIYKSSHVIDTLQKAKLYRRDFLYSVEYATTQTMTTTQITQTTLNAALSTT